ncbi:MAG: hypothetical protein HXX19_11535 [Rhodoferax sp.]|nr:hypothetical protein [Rhodoferax sp.]
MKPFVKAALFGVVLASAVFFFHFLIPVLLLLLFFGLIRRALFGPRWHHAYAGYGRGCGGAGRYGPPGSWSQRTPTVDGRDWQRPASPDTPAQDVQVK